jgi:hypothetical protein
MPIDDSVTEEKARAALAAFDGLGGLERWIAQQRGPVTAKLCKTATKLAHVLPIMVAHVEQRESGRSGRSPCDPVADGSPEGMTGGQHRTETNPLVLRSSARAGHFAQLRGHWANLAAVPQVLDGLTWQCLLWAWISAAAVPVGAALNAELEREAMPGAEPPQARP